MAPSAYITALIWKYVGEQLADSPWLATQLGAAGHDEQLGDFSAEAFERRERQATQWHQAFDQVPATGLDLDDSIDRELALSALRGHIIMADWHLWRRDPLVYLGPTLSSVHLLFVRRRLAEPELARAAAARLRQVPAVLAAARRNLDPELMPPLFVERALDQVRVAPRFAREMVPAELPDPDLRAEVGAAGEEAATAYEQFAQWLTELAGVASGDWMLGEARYSALLREREMLGYGALELRERGRSAYAELDEAMSQVAARVSGVPGVPGGSSDWRAVMAALNADHPPTPEAMRKEYAAATQRARHFLVEHDLVSFAEREQCNVVPAPVFQRGVLGVASYMGPAALTSDRVGHFFVPTPPDGATPEQIEQRLRTNSLASIPTISAHEAYPGHHWHMSWCAGSDRILRKLLRTPYLTEGWALYGERVMAEHGFFAEPRHELAHLEARILRAARIVVDTSLHVGDMGFDEAVEFMVTNTSLSRGTARLEVRRYCAWPVQAPAYLTGSLEIERIRERWRQANQNAPLRQFHDRLAGSGSLPLGLAGKVVLNGVP